MKNFNICFTSNDKYAPFMSTVIVSILKNSKEDENFYFHVITNDISDENKNMIEKLKEIKTFDIKYYIPNVEKYNKWFEKINHKRYYDPSHFYRLDIPTLTSSCDKILYLDCDIIVNSSLSELFDMDISEYFAFAVEDKGDLNFLNKYKIKIGLEDKHKYFNAGILLLNNKLYLEKNLDLECESYFNKYCNIIECADQDILNYLFKDNVKFIDNKWNDFTSKNVNTSSIIHYVGKIKPWNRNCPSNEAVELFWNYFYYTPYYQQNPMKYMQMIMDQKIKGLGIHSNDYLNNKIDKLINKISWFIPFKSMREDFRNSFLE
ncbi:glycosyltransferase family 8 protein [Brachyspira intermedia]|uniref:glycosyltransferase family 8 protein n=1 Tax=Brachyspira intermedia TaxID=84377 RepID=UPI003006C9BF